jgi:hypothetical protein
VRLVSLLWLCRAVSDPNECRDKEYDAQRRYGGISSMEWGDGERSAEGHYKIATPQASFTWQSRPRPVTYRCNAQFQP